MKKLTALFSLILILLAGTALALPFNDRTPPVTGNLGSLQTELNNLYGVGLFDVNSQDPAAIFIPSVAGPTSSSFMLLLELAGFQNDNVFGIYSYSDPTKMLQIFGGPDSPYDSAAVSFFNGSVKLGNNNSTLITNFGTAFGFYITTPEGNTFYSEDDKNPNDAAQMLIYRFPTVPNEFLIAIEDLFYASGDKDFNDMVVKASEVKPVPEPVSMLLFGTGLVGVGGYIRRKFKK